MKKILLFMVIAAIVFGALKLFKTRQESKQNQTIPIERHYAIETLEVKEKSLQERRAFLAEIKPVQGVSVASKLSGIITGIRVSENSIVKKGDLLIQIDDGELQSNLSALASQKKAQLADLDYARSLLDRNEKLYKAGGLSREKYDASVVTYQNKTAALETTAQKIKQIKIQLDYLNIKAPFDGTVSALLLHAGDLVLPGKSILKLHSNAQQINFSYMPTSKSISVGKSVLYQNRKIGTVSKLYDHSENGLLVAEISLDVPMSVANHSLLNIEVVTNEKRGCAVPLSALLHQNSAVSVMLYQDEHFTPLAVNIILQDHQEALVTPCPSFPVATASEAKLSLLPSLGKVKVSR